MGVPIEEVKMNPERSRKLLGSLFGHPVELVLEEASSASVERL